MAGGLVGVGRQQLNGALQGGAAASAREKERNAANEQMKEAAKAQRMNTMVSMGTTGAALGAMAISNPVGWIAGGVIGLLGGSLFG